MHLIAIDIANLQKIAAWLGPTIVMNPSPRSQIRSGLR